MENKSILNSTKKILGLSPEFTAFDLDIITHINSVFSILNQMGIGPAAGYFIEDEQDEWFDFAGVTLDVNGDPVWTNAIVPELQLNLAKTYMYLKVRPLFDPPGTSFLIEATNKQIAECEWRLNLFREMAKADAEA